MLPIALPKVRASRAAERVVSKGAMVQINQWFRARCMEGSVLGIDTHLALVEDDLPLLVLVRRAEIEEDVHREVQVDQPLPQEEDHPLFPGRTM